MTAFIFIFFFLFLWHSYFSTNCFNGLRQSKKSGWLYDQHVGFAAHSSGKIYVLFNRWDYVETVEIGLWLFWVQQTSLTIFHSAISSSDNNFISAGLFVLQSLDAPWIGGRELLLCWLCCFFFQEVACHKLVFIKILPISYIELVFQFFTLWNKAFRFDCQDLLRNKSRLPAPAAGLAGVSCLFLL